jgi:hypothetical protein
VSIGVISPRANDWFVGRSVVVPRLLPSRWHNIAALERILDSSTGPSYHQRYLLSAAAFFASSTRTSSSPEPKASWWLWWCRRWLRQRPSSSLNELKYATYSAASTLFYSDTPPSCHPQDHSQLQPQQLFTTLPVRYEACTTTPPIRRSSKVPARFPVVVDLVLSVQPVILSKAITSRSAAGLRRSRESL